MKRKIISFGAKLLLFFFILNPFAAYGSMLQWDPGSEDTTGFRIYYGGSQGTYTNSLDVGLVTQYSMSDLPLTEGATYYFVLRAYNAAGESDNSNEMSWTAPDSTPPAAPAGVSYNEQNTTLQWSANSESDLKEYRVYTGTVSRNYSPFISVAKETSYSPSGLIEGQTYYFAITAVDASNNESGYSNEVIWTIPAQLVVDTTKPLIAISSPTVESVYQTNSNSITISGTASDNIGVTQVRWTNSRGGSDIASGTNNWTVQGVSLAEGNNAITVTARDAAGNEVSSTLNVTYTLPDTIKPVIKRTSPTTGGYYYTRNKTLNISGTASDNKGVVAVLWSNSKGGSGTAAGTTNWSVTGITLVVGGNTITVTAKDAGGNSASSSLYVVRR